MKAPLLFSADLLRGAESALASLEAESLLRACLPVFVNSYNQLMYLSDTLEWFWRHGFRNVTVVDQKSTYRPLLEFFDSKGFSSRFRLLRQKENIGPRRALDLAPVVRDGVPHIFTDPDLGLPEPPHEMFLQEILRLSRKYRMHKVGLALDIEDRGDFIHRIVDTDETDGPISVIDWERQFWREELEPGVFRANVDTTFYLLNPAAGLDWRNVRRKLFGRPLKVRSLRLAGDGFLARHRPWHLNDQMPDEEAAFLQNLGAAWSTVYRTEAPPRDA